MFCTVYMLEMSEHFLQLCTFLLQTYQDILLEHVRLCPDIFWLMDITIEFWCVLYRSWERWQ